MDPRLENAISRQLLIAVANVRAYASQLNDTQVMESISRDDNAKGFVQELTTQFVSLCKRPVLSLKPKSAA